MSLSLFFVFIIPGVMETHNFCMASEVGTQAEESIDDAEGYILAGEAQMV